MARGNFLLSCFAQILEMFMASLFIGLSGRLSFLQANLLQINLAAPLLQEKARSSEMKADFAFFTAHIKGCCDDKRVSNENFAFNLVALNFKSFSLFFENKASRWLIASVEAFTDRVKAKHILHSQMTPIFSMSPSGSLVSLYLTKFSVFCFTFFLSLSFITYTHSL